MSRRAVKRVRHVQSRLLSLQKQPNCPRDKAGTSGAVLKVRIDIAAVASLTVLVKHSSASVNGEQLVSSLSGPLMNSYRSPTPVNGSLSAPACVGAKPPRPLTHAWGTCAGDNRRKTVLEDLLAGDWSWSSADSFPGGATPGLELQSYQSFLPPPKWFTGTAISAIQEKKIPKLHPVCFFVFAFELLFKRSILCDALADDGYEWISISPVSSSTCSNKQWNKRQTWWKVQRVGWSKQLWCALVVTERQTGTNCRISCSMQFMH